MLCCCNILKDGINTADALWHGVVHLSKVFSTKQEALSHPTVFDHHGARGGCQPTVRGSDDVTRSLSSGSRLRRGKDPTGGTDFVGRTQEQSHQTL